MSDRSVIWPLRIDSFAAVVTVCVGGGARVVRCRWCVGAKPIVVWW